MAAAGAPRLHPARSNPNLAKKMRHSPLMAAPPGDRPAPTSSASSASSPSTGPKAPPFLHQWLALPPPRTAPGGAAPGAVEIPPKSPIFDDLGRRNPSRPSRQYRRARRALPTHLRRSITRRAPTPAARPPHATTPFPHAPHASSPRFGAPMPKSTTAVDHRALEQLRRILRLLTSLKVISALPLTARDPTPLSLIPSLRLRILELRRCDLSTSAARGLLELRHTLEKLICHNSTDALRHVFASRIADIKESPVWNRLSFVSGACNGLVLMDESLRLLPVVETLDLSRNRFARADNLRMCVKLKHPDLGFNQLRTIGCLSTISCPIVRLVLRNNALTTLNRLQNLKSVEGLDLSHNIISSFSELEILASLPCLQNLWLEGNPLCCARLVL